MYEIPRPTNTIFGSQCKVLLRAVADAMDASSSILIHDSIDPPTFGNERPRKLDAIDMHMIASFNVHSRTEDEWREIITGADTRLNLHHIWKGNDVSVVMEVRLGLQT